MYGQKSTHNRVYDLAFIWIVLPHYLLHPAVTYRYVGRIRHACQYEQTRQIGFFAHLRCAKWKIYALFVWWIEKSYPFFFFKINHSQIFQRTHRVLWYTGVVHYSLRFARKVLFSIFSHPLSRWFSKFEL